MESLFLVSSCSSGSHFEYLFSFLNVAANAKTEIIAVHSTGGKKIEKIRVCLTVLAAIIGQAKRFACVVKYAIEKGKGWREDRLVKGMFRGRF